MRRRHLQCACCGNAAGRWQQHPNRDTGFGICAPCVAWLLARWETPESIESKYGTEGVHWGAAADGKTE